MAQFLVQWYNFGELPTCWKLALHYWQTYDMMEWFCNKVCSMFDSKIIQFINTCAFTTLQLHQQLPHCFFWSMLESQETWLAKHYIFALLKIVRYIPQTSFYSFYFINKEVIHDFSNTTCLWLKLSFNFKLMRSSHWLPAHEVSQLSTSLQSIQAKSSLYLLMSKFL